MTPLTKELLATMAAVSGFSTRSIISRQRHSPLPALRWMIGRELLRHGYTNSFAARELRLDHATLLHGIKTLDAMKDDEKGWRLEIEIEHKFKYAINGYRRKAMDQQKEPSERRDHRRAFRNYGYGHCYSRSGWMGNGMHLMVGCDGDCRRMKIYDNKHGLTGPFKIDY